MYGAWAVGRLPDHRPSLGELFLLERGFGKDEPVAVIGVPQR